MDLSFFRRAEQRFASQRAAEPDFGLLVATLRTQQAMSASAKAEAVCTELPSVEEPLVELVLAGPRWRLAAAALRGSFHPQIARQGAVN